MDKDCRLIKAALLLACWNMALLEAASTAMHAQIAMADSALTVSACDDIQCL